MMISCDLTLKCDLVLESSPSYFRFVDYFPQALLIIINVFIYAPRLPRFWSSFPEFDGFDCA